MSVTCGGRRSNLKQVRKQGFRARSKTATGRKVLNARRRKGRKELAVQYKEK